MKSIVNPYPLIVNVGLDGAPEGESYTNGVRNTGVPAKALHAVQALRHAGFVVKSARVLQSDTEPTLVATVLHAQYTLAFSGRRVAELLGQDCIAIHDPRSGQGWLYGPGAHKWGQFAPELFLMPSGLKLDPCAA